MTVARTNPLAAGVYWISIFEPFGSSTVHNQDEDFTAWLEASGDAVHVDRRETQDVLPGEGPEGEDRDRVPVFYVFEVLSGATPAPFPFTALGFPTIQKLATAPGGVTDADRDVPASATAQKPAPGGLGDWLRGGLENMSPMTLLVLAGVAYVALQSGKGRR